MNSFFWWSGVVSWGAVGCIAVAAILFLVHDWWTSEVPEFDGDGGWF